MFFQFFLHMILDLNQLEERAEVKSSADNSTSLKELD